MKAKLELERRQTRIRQLRAELRRIKDPLQEIREMEDLAACTLLHRADHLCRKMNNCDPAAEIYRTIVKRYPQNQWARLAEQRLAEIQKGEIP